MRSQIQSFPPLLYAGWWAQVAGIVNRPHDHSTRVVLSITTVDGAMNAVMVQGDAVGTTLYYGKGAGSEPTASAVVGTVTLSNGQVITYTVGNLSPGQSVSIAGGLVCSNVITGADADAAVSASCSASATDSLGQVLPVTVSACQALPPPANPLAVGGSLVCDIAFTAPGTAGGEDTPATALTLTASTSAINDINAGNDSHAVALPLLLEL